MKKTAIRTLLALGLILSASAARADNLDLTEGTMTTGGAVKLSYERGDISNMNSDNLRWDARINIGYFIMDNFDVEFEINAGGYFNSTLVRPAGTKLGAAIGANYFFDTGSMVNPYVGVMPGIQWGIMPAGTTDTWMLRVPVKVGALIALNSHVALDFGLEGALSWQLETGSPNTTFIDGSIGYAGVRAFF